MAHGERPGSVRPTGPRLALAVLGACAIYRPAGAARSVVQRLQRRAAQPTYYGCADHACKIMYVKDRCAYVEAVQAAQIYKGTDPMSRSVCATFCSEKKAFYFILQNATNCWCGAYYTPYAQAGTPQCQLPCPGNPSETCGGKEGADVFILGTVDAQAEMQGIHMDFKSTTTTTTLPPTTTTTTTTTTTADDGKVGHCQHFGAVEDGTTCSGGTRTVLGDMVPAQQCRQKCEALKKVGCCECLSSSGLCACTFNEKGKGAKSKLEADQTTVAAQCGVQERVEAQCDSFDKAELKHMCYGDDALKTFFGTNIAYDVCRKKCSELGRAGCCESRATSWGSCAFFENGKAASDRNHDDTKAVNCVGN